MGDRQRFREASQGATTSGRLAEAALCIAAEADPEVDIDAELAALGELAAGCPADLPGLRSYLFEDLGFRGNASRYYDPRNSYLHEVRRRRRGIPISLSVLAMEVGRLAGVPLLGIGMPGHFLTRSATDPSLYLDAFSGRLLSTDGVRTLFASLAGDVPLDERWLEPVDTAAIVRRMLANLRQIFHVRLDDGSALWTYELELELPSPSEDLRTARAACLARLFRVDEAAAAFEELAAEAASRGDQGSAAARLQLAKAARAVLQ